MIKNILSGGVLIACAFAFTASPLAFAEETNDTTTSNTPTTSVTSTPSKPPKNSAFDELIKKFQLQLEKIRAEKASTTAAFKEARKTNASSTKERNVDATCMQGVIKTREAALAAGWSTLNTSITSALSARAVALDSAWAKTDVTERNKAVKDAWSAWKKAHRDAFAKMRTARREAWDTFKKTARETCKTNVPQEEALSSDAAGSVSL